MRLYIKLLLLLFLLAFAAMKFMFATDKSSDNSLNNMDLNTKSTGNYRLFRPEADIKLGMQKLSTTTFSFEDNSCSMLY